MLGELAEIRKLKALTIQVKKCIQIPVPDQRFLVSDWTTGFSPSQSDTSHRCMLSYQISTLCVIDSLDTIIFSHLKNKDLLHPIHLPGINSKMLLFETTCLRVGKCDTCQDKDIFHTCCKLKTACILVMGSKIPYLTTLLEGKTKQCHWISILKIYTRPGVWKLMQYWLYFQDYWIVYILCVQQ